METNTECPKCKHTYFFTKLFAVCPKCRNKFITAVPNINTTFKGSYSFNKNITKKDIDNTNFVNTRTARDTGIISTGHVGDI